MGRERSAEKSRIGGGWNPLGRAPTPLTYLDHSEGPFVTVASGPPMEHFSFLFSCVYFPGGSPYAPFRSLQLN